MFGLLVEQKHFFFANIASVCECVWGTNKKSLLWMFDSFVRIKTWIINKQESNHSKHDSARLLFKVAMNHRHGVPTRERKTRMVTAKAQNSGSTPQWTLPFHITSPRWIQSSLQVIVRSPNRLNQFFIQRREKSVLVFSNVSDEM